MDESDAELLAFADEDAAAATRESRASEIESAMSQAYPPQPSRPVIPSVENPVPIQQRESVPQEAPLPVVQREAAPVPQREPMVLPPPPTATPPTIPAVDSPTNVPIAPVRTQWIPREFSRIPVTRYRTSEKPH